MLAILLANSRNMSKRDTFMNHYNFKINMVDTFVSQK